MKRIFIAATSQNDGKTTVSLGLLCHFQSRFKNVSFIKPIGQRYLEDEGLKIDEDSLLIEEVCGIKRGLKDMSPIAVEKGFTERYITRPEKKAITQQIRQAFSRVSKGSDAVVIEGTGHAGVGSVFDHSNAYVAKLLGAKVIIISSGGVGRPIDEILLNRALFEREGVKVWGVVINKVLPSKFDKINKFVRTGLKRQGINVLGVLPYNPFLSAPTIAQIIEETDFKLLSGRGHLDRYVSRVIVGAMHPKEALKYIVDDSLLITPGDREDIITAVAGCFRNTDAQRLKVAGIVLSGALEPPASVMEMLQQLNVPVLLAQEDTYDVASTLHDMTVKIHSSDTAKIKEIVKMIHEYVDLDGIVKGM